MWRMMTRLATAASIATLALVASTASEARAAAQTYSYSTSGDISGMSGDVPITFAGVTGSNTLTSPGNFTLGTFTTDPLPPTATLTYNNTPFTIDLSVKDYTPPGEVSPYYQVYNSDYKIHGVLNGTITGVGTSNMFASVTSVTGADSGIAGTPPFPVANLLFNLPQQIAAPNGETVGTTTLLGQIIPPSGTGLPAPAPEPSTIAVFAAALIGFAFNRKYRGKSTKPALD